MIILLILATWHEIRPPDCTCIYDLYHYQDGVLMGRDERIFYDDFED